MTQNSMVSQTQKNNNLEEEDYTKYTCLGEFLIAKIQKHEAALYSLLVPIIENLEAKNSV